MSDPDDEDDPEFRLDRFYDDEADGPVIVPVKPGGAVRPPPPPPPPDGKER